MYSYLHPSAGVAHIFHVSRTSGIHTQFQLKRGNFDLARKICHLQTQEVTGTDVQALQLLLELPLRRPWQQLNWHQSGSVFLK